MTRGRQPEAPDLHERFGLWLQAGAPGEPARDVAVHAAHCPGCRALVDAWDRLALIDTGLAPMPPSGAKASAPGRRLPLRAGTALAGATAVVAVAALIGASGPGLPGFGQSAGTPSSDQQVLGGAGAGENRPSPSASPETRATGTPTATPSATPEASPEPASQSASPDGTPLPIVTPPPPPPPPPTPRPTAAPTPTRPTPTPKATPSEEPSVPPPSVPPSEEPSVPPPTEEPSTPASVEPSASPG